MSETKENARIPPPPLTPSHCSFHSSPPLSDDIKTLSPSSLVNLDRSSTSMNRESLQYLIRQLADIPEVRTVNLSSNHLTDECSQEFADLVTLDRKGAENPKEQVRRGKDQALYIQAPITQIFQLTSATLPTRPFARRQVGFTGIDISFNDLGPKAAEKVMKFGVQSKWLSYLNLEGNIDIAVENNMGAFMADNIKAGAGSGGGVARKGAR